MAASERTKRLKAARARRRSLRVDRRTARAAALNTGIIDGDVKAVGSAVVDIIEATRGTADDAVTLSTGTAVPINNTSDVLARLDDAEVTIDSRGGLQQPA